MADALGTRRAAALGAVALLATAGTSFGQAWVTFNNETDNRLVGAPGLVKNDVQEKDYEVGDFDNDGDTDLVIARKQPFTTTGKFPNVLLMNENGQLVDRTVEFASAADVPGDQGFLTPTNDRDITVVDVDLDGWLDVVTGPTYSSGDKHITHPRIYHNKGVDGDGNWLGFVFENDRFPTHSNTIGPNACHVDTGDINGDGFPDLWFINYDGFSSPFHDAKMYWNDGNGYFTDETNGNLTPSMQSTGFGASGWVVDLNGDGANDLTKQSAGSAEQIYNNPAKEGSFSQMLNLTGGAVYFTSWGDLNNDNKPDFIISSDGQDNYMLNTGNSAQGIAQFQTKSVQYDVGSDDGFAGNSHAADLNNDGWQDVLITDVDVDIPGCGRRMHIYRNLGNAPSVTLKEQNIGGKVANIPTGMLSGTQDVAVLDINNDGWLDLVVGRCSGTQLWINQPPIGATVSYPGGLPANVEPGEPLVVTAEISPFGGASVDPENVSLAYKVNNGALTAMPMVEVPAGSDESSLFQAVIPGVDCADIISFQISAILTSGQTVLDPPIVNGYNNVTASLGTEIIETNFETPAVDWQVVTDPTNLGGAWEQGKPFGTTFGGQQAAPSDDAQGNQAGSQAFVTGIGESGAPAAAFDIDGGPVSLISPTFELAGTDATLSYSRWWFCSDFGNPAEQDSLRVEITNNGGATWTLVEEVFQSQQWHIESFKVSDFVVPTNNVRVRFTAADLDNASITEAGIDVFSMRKIICKDTPACPGDLTGDGAVGSTDLNVLLGSFGLDAGGDLDGDGDTDSADLNVVLAAFGGEC